MTGVPVRMSGIELAYGERRVLDSVDLEIGSGDRYVITGENGAGKTSIIKIALGLLSPHRGTVLLFGSPPRGKRGNRRLAGYVHQGAVDVDFPISAREVVSIGLSGTRVSRATRNRIVDESMELTRCLGLSDRPYRVLSGGEKQRVSIARCLCQQPRLLFLDEPFAALDRDSCSDLSKLLSELPPEIAIVMVSHRAALFGNNTDPGPDGPDEAFRSFIREWRILRLENGRLS